MGTWADAFHAQNPNIAMAISEYGAGGSINQHEADPSDIVTTGTFHPEEYESLYHEQVWPQLAARPWIWAKSVWNMFDFAEDERNEGDTPGMNDKGLVTSDRKTKKDAFYYYKVQWSNREVRLHHQPALDPRTDATDRCEDLLELRQRRIVRQRRVTGRDDGGESCVCLGRCDAGSGR